MTDTEWAYFAGLVDGEGHLSLSRQIDDRHPEGVYYKVSFAIRMIDLPTIEWICTHVGGRFYTIQPYKSHWKIAYMWQPLGGNAEILRIINEIMPYLVTKKTNAFWVKQYCELRSGVRRRFMGNEEHDLYALLKGNLGEPLHIGVA
jgi:hypothetical protein